MRVVVKFLKWLLKSVVIACLIIFFVNIAGTLLNINIPPEFLDLPDYILFAGAGGDYSDNIFFIVILLDKSILIG